MRLLILEDASQMGGVQHSTLNFLRGLQSISEVYPLLLLPGPGPFSEICEQEDLPFAFYPREELVSSSISLLGDRLRLPNLLGLINNQRKIRQQVHTLLPIMQNFQPDIVLTKGMGAHLKGGRACRILGIPCVWHQQDFISERYGGTYRRLFGWLVRQYARHIIADGSPIRAQLPPTVQTRCSVVLNGVPLETFYQPEQRTEARAAFQIPKDAYLIGHLARITPWKGQHLLLEAFSQYAKENLASHLLLIGSPLFGGEAYLRQLQRRIKELGLEERVHLPGYLNNLGFALSAIDTFIYPSVEKDTSPLALISALAAGLPAGVSDILGLREMVEGCEGVVLFPNRNLEQMRSVMAHYADPDLRGTAARINRAWAQSHFSQEAYTTQLLNILNTVYGDTL